MYEVNITKHAERELKRLDRTTKNRIVTASLALAHDPRPPACLRVKTSDGRWRIRVGDWRIGYEIDDAAQIITIVTIGHRREFYD